MNQTLLVETTRKIQTEQLLKCKTFFNISVEVSEQVASHFVPRSFRTHFGHFVPTVWSFRTSNNHFVPRTFRTHFGHFVPRSTGYEIDYMVVISYPSHFVPTLVISYLLFGHFVPNNNHFVPRSFRTHFGHFVPRSTGYEMTIWWSVRTQVISVRTLFGLFVPSKMDGWMGGWVAGLVGWMDGWMDGWTDRLV